MKTLEQLHEEALSERDAAHNEISELLSSRHDLECELKAAVTELESVKHQYANKVAWLTLSEGKLKMIKLAFPEKGVDFSPFHILYKIKSILNGDEG